MIKKYAKRFLKSEYGGESLEFLCVLAVAAGVIAIGVNVVANGNSILADMINGV